MKKFFLYEKSRFDRYPNFSIPNLINKLAVATVVIFLFLYGLRKKNKTNANIGNRTVPNATGKEGTSKRMNPGVNVSFFLVDQNRSSAVGKKAEKRK